MLVYLVDEEKDIYIGVLVAVCRLASWTQLERLEDSDNRRLIIDLNT